MQHASTLQTRYSRLFCRHKKLLRSLEQKKIVNRTLSFCALLRHASTTLTITESCSSSARNTLALSSACEHHKRSPIKPTKERRPRSNDFNEVPSRSRPRKHSPNLQKLAEHSFFFSFPKTHPYLSEDAVALQGLHHQVPQFRVLLHRDVPVYHDYTN